jgi:hypothetical protein
MVATPTIAGANRALGQMAHRIITACLLRLECDDRWEGEELRTADAARHFKLNQ